jgi:uncharacterized membrane protein YtjA (UPF0391 family)
MLTTTIVLLVLTLASAVLGFREILPPVSRIFELLFWVFGVLFVVFLNILLMRRTWSEQVSGQDQEPGQ